uniref:SJCHGC03699 protein n=1 Tax=Schistosoma japonicum TaxID=6182 RepID=Q5BSN8_SCHJA|nr:SJCHGC03699 protein [Schistosoma japonicum]
MTSHDKIRASSEIMRPTPLLTTGVTINIGDQPRTDIPWALRSHSRVIKTFTYPLSFSGTSKRTLPQCVQPESDNRTHTFNST